MLTTGVIDPDCLDPKSIIIENFTENFIESFVETRMLKLSWELGQGLFGENS